MRRLGRKGRMIKWAGLVLSLLMAAVWAFSLRYSPCYRRTVGDWFFVEMRLHRGTFSFFAQRGLFYPDGGTLFFENVPSMLPKLPLSFRIGWNTPTWITVPLWMPLVVILIPTALLWWRDRRRIPPGHCQKCGYNLTGNVSGVCPECGERVSEEQSA